MSECLASDHMEISSCFELFPISTGCSRCWGACTYQDVQKVRVERFSGP